MFVRQKMPEKILQILVQVFISILVFISVIIYINPKENGQQFTSLAATTNCSVTASQLTVTAQEQSLLDEINIYRTQHGLGQLTLDPTLKQAAAWMSNNMATNNSLSHTDSFGRTAEMRLTDCGYTVTVGYAEEIAEGTTDPTSIFNDWENDTAHEAVLLTPQYTVAGIDAETSTAGSTFWTVEFGLNSGSANNTTVTATPSGTITPILTPSATISPTISPTIILPTGTPEPETSDMLISPKVEIYGIGNSGNENPKHKTRQITATVYGPGNQIITTGTAFLSYDGSNYFSGVIHLGKMTQGAYFIKLASANTLQKLVKPEFQNLNVNQVNNLPSVTLFQGDMNGDNVININDYNLVLPCFQSISTCQNVSELDFNDDGVVDVRDYNLFLQSFETQYGD